MKETMKYDIPELAAGIHDRVLTWQRTIHADPEIGFDTVRTAALVAGELRSAGVAVREGVGRTGVVGDIEVPGAAQCMALRADMDALPMDEENDVPHRSRNPGAAHMCGHDAHTAMLLGAAHVLAGRKEQLSCSVRFIFQPNEEALPGGAPAMIQEKCLEGIDCIFGLHIWPFLDTGCVGILPGPAMAQPDIWRITLTGKGGHAATPHETRDPVIAAAHLVSALQTVVARNVDPLDAAVLSVTQIHAGSADNIIPEQAEVRGTIRSFRKEVGETVRTRLREVARSVADTFGMEAEVKVTQGYPVVVNDATACAYAEKALENTVPTTRDVQPSLGGEDFSYYLEKTPGAFLFLGNRDVEKGIEHFCHHPRFQVDENALKIGVQTWLALVLRLFPEAISPDDVSGCSRSRGIPPED